MKRIISMLLVLITISGVIAGLNFNSSAITEVWESEPNDSEIQANSFNFGQVMIGRLSGYTDYDHFKFNVNTNMQFRLVFDHDYPDKLKYNYWGIDIYKFDPYSYEYEHCTGMTVGDFESTKKTKTLVANAGDSFLISIAENNGPSPLAYMMSLEPVVSKISGMKCTARNTTAQKIAWNKLAGSSGYLVQRSNNGGTAWSNYYTTTSTSYIFKDLTAGGKYKFRARAYKTVSGKKYYGAWSSTLCSCTTPAKPTLKSVSSPKHTQIKATWAKASGTKSGYQIVYGKNSSFTSIVAKKNVSASYSSYTGKNFTKGITYYVKVRTYTTFSGKAYYSAWSSAKKVKCK